MGEQSQQRCEQIIEEIDAGLAGTQRDEGLDGLHNFEWVLMHRYEQGEITFDELSEALDRYIGWIASGRPTYVGD
jgi:hypothetical protein